MSRVPIPTPLLRELLALFDRAHQSITGAENVRLQGIPGWELFRGEEPRNPLLESWLERVGDAGFYVVEADREPVPVEIEYDRAGTIGYRCPDTFRRVLLPEQEAGVYVVNPQPLLTLIADLLDIAQADRRQLDTAHLDGALWHLGPARLGQVRMRIPLKMTADSEERDRLAHRFLTGAGFLLRAVTIGQLGGQFAHRFPAQFEAVRTVQQSVEDGVRQGRLADVVVPVLGG